jgi:hypothetical protein
MDPLDSAAALAEWLDGSRPHPSPGSWLRYDETKWSYRQPISYRVTDDRGRLVADIGPDGGRTRFDSVVVRDGTVLLRTRFDRRGNTTVSDPAGRSLGQLRRSNRLATYRLRLRWAGRDVGSVEQKWNQTGEAEIIALDGTVAASVRRDDAGRLSGARTSWLLFSEVSHLLPAALLLTAAPALDAMRARGRRRRM